MSLSFYTVSTSVLKKKWVVEKPHQMRHAASTPNRTCPFRRSRELTEPADMKTAIRGLVDNSGYAPVTH
jgi:hypothetical protein